MASSLFVDTSGWASFMHAHDPSHAQAVQLYRQAYDRHAAIYTTDHVLAELVALLASRHYKMPRPRVIAIIQAILSDPGVTIASTSWPNFLNAWQLIEQRQDKSWSQVD